MDKKIIFGIITSIALIVIIIGIFVFGNFFVKENSVNRNPVKISETGEVKEFRMESFTNIVDGQFFPQFSIKEITVKKGDLVRLLINTTSGTHNINIDEFSIHEETPAGKITVVEFVADKVGEFEYYCSKPRHRELGHWGTLKVIE